jgi:hypothetical protein
LPEREPFRSRRKPLTHSSPPTKIQGEQDEKDHDSNDADDVRYPGKRTGYIAGVRPDEADSRPYDEQSDHRR